ncbi:MAG: hypothetical protein ACR2P0_03880 [Acidimicrobiales bacterium]
MSSIARQDENPRSPRRLPVEPRPERNLLQKLGVGTQPPAQAEYGSDAYPSILRRITSLFSLGALVLFLGIAIAGVIGSIILVALFLLEQAISS